MINWTIRELEGTESTQKAANELAAKGAPEGTTVVARFQTAGQGRLGRAWASPPGGLYMSFVLRPDKVQRPESIPLASALSVVEGVASSTGLKPRIRWPNDVLLGFRKLGGVIADAQSYHDRVSQVVVGVGVNCNATISGLEAGAGEATSLLEELDHQVEIPEVRNSILNSFANLYERLKAGEDLTPLWTQSVGTLGKSVTIKLRADKEAFPANVVDVTSDGGIIVVRDRAGTIVYSEDLEWLKEG
jgi:BirA family transcriptional regulator, biotin operon repressor / biotin---[acetyl-CoA-carboxylase] ligase